jgi:hypothetical protein
MRLVHKVGETSPNGSFWASSAVRGTSGTMSVAPQSDHQATTVEKVCSWLAFVIPWLVAMGRMGAGSQSLNDPSLIRGVGLVAMGGEGLVSALLAQFVLLLPFGGSAVRMAIVSAIGLGVMSALCFGTLIRMLSILTLHRVWVAVLAFLGTMLVALGPVSQTEAVRPGGKTVAAALLLGTATLMMRRDHDPTVVGSGHSSAVARSIGVGLLLGLLGAENLVLMVVAALLAVVASYVRQPEAAAVSRSTRLGVVGGVIVVLAVATGWWASPRTGTVGMSLGLAETLSVLVAGGTRLSIGSSWVGQLGVVIVFLGSAGLIAGVLRRSTRDAVLVLGALLIADTVFGKHDPSDRGSDPFAIPSAVIFCSLSVFALVSCGNWLSRFSKRMALYAMVLGAVLLAVMVAAQSDDAGYTLDPRDSLGVEVWMEEALVELPPGATLVVRDETLFRWVWLTQVTRGERPDVLVVPLLLGNQPEFAGQLLVQEPAVLPVLRDMAMGGTLSEYSLSQLADARPVFVQLGRGMGGRLREHLLPRPMWCEVVAHNVARSDRSSAIVSSRGPVERIMSHVDPYSPADRQVVEMLKSALREQLVVVLALGDRELAKPLMQQYMVVDDGDAWLAYVARILSAQPRGPVVIDG